MCDCTDMIDTLGKILEQETRDDFLLLLFSSLSPERVLDIFLVKIIKVRMVQGILGGNSILGRIGKEFFE